jgi:hypothetical protein
MLFACGAAFGATIFLPPQHEWIGEIVILFAVFVGTICAGILFCVGGFAPEQLKPTLTLEEKLQIDNRLNRDRVESVEHSGIQPDAIQAAPPAESHFAGLPDSGGDSPVSRHIESRKRYSRTVSGAITAIVIYALWNLLS